MRIVKRALLSVYDKVGIVDFARELMAYGIEIVSTGGTLATLQKNGIRATAVDTLTGFPEIMNGRVKTLHPKIHGGILAVRDDKTHMAQMTDNGILPIDLVVITLYPFEETVAARGVTLEKAIEKIDIGGPTMLRAAAKNWRYVTAVCDRQDYALISKTLEECNGRIPDEVRLQCAQKVFARTSAYDYAIQNYLQGQLPQQELFPKQIHMLFEREHELRYGENPHQKAALYRVADVKKKPLFTQCHGKELSYNNIVDLYAAIDIVREFGTPVACVVKHNNPCGIAEHENLAKAVVGAIDSDPLSAFGGIIGLNEVCSLEVAETVLRKLKFFEIIVAPGFTKEALVALKVRKNVRIIKIDRTIFRVPRATTLDLKKFPGGILLQETDRPLQNATNNLEKTLRVVTKKKPGKKDIAELLFAWRCVKVVKSNAIVITKNRKTIGIGAGQMSRVGAMEIACKQAGPKACGAFVASDAFFPMADNITVAARSGIKAIIQPGGSIRDTEVIAAADKKGIAMAFTGTRHFKH